jgi:hypothetical protein
MTSPRKLFVNRLNAQRSSGPKTSAGKARVGQNARRHGLSVLAQRDPARSGEIAALAREIAGDDANARRLELATRIAAAQFDVVQARRVRLARQPEKPDKPGAIRRLAAVDRYEGRALSRRNQAIREFDNEP